MSTGPNSLHPTDFSSAQGGASCVLIGHRGTGKTHLLSRMRKYDWQIADLQFLDLDQEIEKRTQKKIPDIFRTSGEIIFRQIENETFQEILKTEKKFVLAVGAGFDLSQIPDEITKIRVQRFSDREGRIFFNRPQLNPDLNPLDDFLSRFAKREQSYQQAADFTYVLPEGAYFDPQAETQLLKIATGFAGPVTRFAGTALTLKPSHLRSQKVLQNLIRSFEYIELRTDLLTPTQMNSVLSYDANYFGQVIISIRTGGDLSHLNSFKDFIQNDKVMIDCDHLYLKNFKNQQIKNPILAKPSLMLSIHDQATPDIRTVNEIEKESAAYLKWSPVISDINELIAAHQWRDEKPKTRLLFPRMKSPNGEGVWYRLWLKGRQALNFVRVDEGSAVDQPTLYQWLSTPACDKNFAAVIGEPVYHSYSPAYHREFFKRYNMPFYPVHIQRESWSKGFHFLKSLGLKVAAVTSPFKKQALAMSEIACADSLDSESVNTIVITDKSVQGFNTDIEGFKKSTEKKELSSFKPVLVWGGGGTLGWLQNLFPNAALYSVRTGHERIAKSGDKFSPQVVIWAAGPLEPDPRERNPNVDYSRLRVIVDLNYKENSGARRLAAQLKTEMDVDYISGLGMFEAQAQAQQKIWESFLK